MRQFTVLCAIMLLLAGCGSSSSVRKEKGHEDRLAAVKAAGVLRAGVKVDAPPFGFKLGQAHAGFEIDILSAVARELGIGTISYVPLASSERINALTSGKVDLVIANMTVTRGRDADIDFSQPYFMDGQMLLVKEGSDISNYLDLSGKKVGCIKDTTGEQNMRVVAPGAELKVFKGNTEMIQALKEGVVDAITTDGVVLEGIRNKNRDAGFKLVGEQFSEEPLAIALAENQSNLRDAINAALQRMSETGEYQSIFDTWFGKGSGYKHVREFHLQTVAP